MSFPYLDLAGFKARSPMPPSDVDAVEVIQPGFTLQKIMGWSSYVNARLRKRYGTGREGSSLPLGQTPPALIPAGTAPPAVSLTGRPTLGSIRVNIAITTPGALGVAAGKWSSDGGQTVNAFTTAATVALDHGLSASFAAGTYSGDNVYAAETPVPETVLTWITSLVTVDLYRKRGVNPQDPTIEMIREDATRALAELKEAADSKDGLFDLPAGEDGDSAVTTGGPLGYAEASPYVWADKERRHGRREDACSLESDGGPDSGIIGDA